MKLTPEQGGRFLKAVSNGDKTIEIDIPIELEAETWEWLAIIAYSLTSDDTSPCTIGLAVRHIIKAADLNGIVEELEKHARIIAQVEAEKPVFLPES